MLRLTGSIATAVGFENWPLPLPDEPNWLKYVPTELKTWIRFATNSSTTIFRLTGSIATPIAQDQRNISENCFTGELNQHSTRESVAYLGS